jgi:hypothetical protein
LETDRERYGPGGRIEARARLRDARYQPIADRDVTIGVVDAEGRAQASRRARTDGEGAVTVVVEAPSKPGAYGVAAWEAEADRTSVLVEQGIVVEASGDELSSPQADPEVLRALAAATSARSFGDLADVDLSKLDRSRTRSLGTSASAPFSSPWFFAVLIALLALEWALRRAWSLR